MDFNDLTEEQKARALECKSGDELAELAMKEGVELSLEELDGAAGGWGEANCGDYTATPCQYAPPHPC